MPRFADMTNEELKAWMLNFIAVVGAAPAKYNLTSAKVDIMQAGESDLSDAMDERASADNVSRAARMTEQMKRNIAEPICSEYASMIKADSSISDADKLAIEVEPNKPPTHTAPVTPTDLVVNGYENNLNILKWDRAGNKPNTMFIVECSETGADFQYLVTTTKTTYEHFGVKPGIQRAYRVKAARSDEESSYSNVAVVYMN